MKLTNQLQNTQKLQVSQNQIQSLEILAMDSIQLGSFMQNEYLENPLLEYTGTQEFSLNTENISNRYEGTLTYGKTYEEAIEEEDSRKKDLPSPDPDFLKNSLLYQLPIQNLTNAEQKLYSYMIDCLDDTGFFSTPLDEIATALHLPLSAVKKALDELQQLEPRGIFARDLRECLLIQLQYTGQRDSDIWKIVDQYLPDVAAGRISTISRALSMSTIQVRKYIEQIAQLNPRPLNAISVSNREYIIPDISLKKENGKWEIELHDPWTENYQINDYYLHLMKNSDDEELVNYFRMKLDRIRFIQNSIQQRKLTILHIVEALLVHQEAFFNGTGSLLPMPMNRLADELQIHPSTISRAVKGKYMQCPQGTLLLKSLFTSAISASGDAEATAADIKKLIYRLILEENKKKPLSDQKIQDLLKEQKINISRRTVAQYREELGIKSSYARKNDT